MVGCTSENGRDVALPVTETSEEYSRRKKRSELLVIPRKSLNDLRAASLAAHLVSCALCCGVYSLSIAMPASASAVTAQELLGVMAAAALLAGYCMSSAHALVYQEQDEKLKLPSKIAKTAECLEALFTVSFVFISIGCALANSKSSKYLGILGCLGALFSMVGASVAIYNIVSEIKDSEKKKSKKSAEEKCMAGTSLGLCVIALALSAANIGIYIANMIPKLAGRDWTIPRLVVITGWTFFMIASLTLIKLERCKNDKRECAVDSVTNEPRNLNVWGPSSAFGGDACGIGIGI